MLSDLAARVGLSERTLRAIMTVERGPYGWDAFRFEPHLFHRATDRRYMRQVLWTPEDPRIPWSVPRSQCDFGAFEVAFQLDPEAAVASSSWGAFQVLDPVGLGAALDAAHWMGRWIFEVPEDLSADLLILWLEHSPMAARYARTAEQTGGTAEAWEGFAKAYNGPRAVATGYPAALARAYAAGGSNHG